VHRADIVVIPSGVDVEMFRPVSIEPVERSRILTVGRLTERKGFADLVAALPLVPGA